MGKRRSSRELAVKFLYQLEINAGALDEQLSQYWQRNPCQDDIREYTEKLVHLVHEHQEEIDALVERVSPNWSVSRMAVIDRNLLRLGVAELLYQKLTPARVVINEAVEIAKRYGGEETPKFINAILDRIKNEKEGGLAPSSP